MHTVKRSSAVSSYHDSQLSKNSQRHGANSALPKQTVTFDVSKHVAPKYTITGNLVSSTKQLKGRMLDANASDLKFPSSWSRPESVKNPNAVRTKTALEKSRRDANVPDKTYDLDGDGQVSQRDYFLAKQFDKDRDGKLNEQELKAAKKALKEGFESKFLFGLEASANQLSANSLIPGFEYETRHKLPVSNKMNYIRVLQKNGKPLVGEDFTPLEADIRKKTSAEYHSAYKTRTEMHNQRKTKDANLLEAAHARYESETLKMLQEQQAVFQVQTPKSKKQSARGDIAKSQSQIHLKTKLQVLQAADKQVHRQKNGMLVEPTDVTTHFLLDKQQKEGVKTTKDLLERRFQADNKDISAKTVMGQENLMKRKAVTDAEERYRKPEKQSIHDMPADLSQKVITKRQLANQRKQILMNKNQATFGKPKYGLHGQPLPNFFYKSSSDARLKSQPARQEDSLQNGGVTRSQTTIEWWRNTEGYKEEPKHISNRVLNRKKKFWAAPDPLYLNEFEKSEAPIDDFKRGRSIKLKQANDEGLKYDKPNSHPLPDNVNYLSPDKPFVPQRKSSASARFSEVYAKPSPSALILQNNQAQSHEAYFSGQPLYSSFAKDKVFPWQPGDKVRNENATKSNDNSPYYIAQIDSVNPKRNSMIINRMQTKKESMVTQASNDPGGIAIRSSNARSSNAGSVQQHASQQSAAGVAVEFNPGDVFHSTSLFERVVQQTQKAVGDLALFALKKPQDGGVEQNKTKQTTQTTNHSVVMNRQKTSTFAGGVKAHLHAPSQDDESELQTANFRATSLTGVRSSGFISTKATQNPTSLEGTFRHQSTGINKDEFASRNMMANRTAQQKYANTLNAINSNRDLIGTMSSQQSSRFQK